MNSGVTKRKEPRFRVHVPVRVKSQNGIQTFTSRDVSTGGCFFDINKPDLIPNGAYDIEITTNGNGIFKISNATLFERRSEGFGFRWQLGSATEFANFVAFLHDKSSEPQVHSKVFYLVNEQKGFFQSLRDISEKKQRGYRFLFGLIAAYFFYLAAPLHFLEIKTVEQAAFYSIGGLWASLILLYHCLRFLHWLGSSVRRKVFLTHALSSNRAWMFSNDGSYYGKSLFPMGATYDDSRSWGKNKDDKMEKFASNISYRSSTTIFHFLVQALFAFGMILFLSVILRAVLEKEELLTGGFRLFDANYFWRTYSGGCMLLLIWIQNCANGCQHYKRRVWEARRISAGRPNPRFTGAGLRQEQPDFYRIARLLGYCAWGFGFAALAFMLFGHRIFGNHAQWAYEYLNHWLPATIFLGLFLFGKILYTSMQIKAETNQDRLSRPIFEFNEN